MEKNSVKKENTAEKEYNGKMDQIEKKMGEIEYERGGLGLFNFQRKKELRARMRELKKEQNDLMLEKETGTFDQKVNDFVARANELEEEFKSRFVPIQQELESTALTAFKRTKELKEKSDVLEQLYESEKKPLVEAINSEIEQLDGNEILKKNKLIKEYKERLKQIIKNMYKLR